MSYIYRLMRLSLQKDFLKRYQSDTCFHGTELKEAQKGTNNFFFFLMKSPKVTIIGYLVLFSQGGIWYMHPSLLFRPTLGTGKLFWMYAGMAIIC